MNSGPFTVIDFDPDVSQRPEPPCGQKPVPKDGLAIPALKTMLRQLQQEYPGVTKEELQELCFYLGKKLLSRERAVITLNNRIKNLQSTIGQRTRKKRG